jgi:hypothetical protein
MDELSYHALYIKVKDPNDHDMINTIAKELKDAVEFAPILTYQQLEQTEEV